MCKTGRFTRVERVKRSEDIKILFKKGRCFNTSGAKLFLIENGLSFSRAAFALPRGYGNAVQRNKSKRLSREAYRQFKVFLNTGYDILFLVYPGKDTFKSRYTQFNILINKAGLLRK